RSRLCELLGDIADDPRGELRWCLSKLRPLLDEPDRSRLLSADDLVWLDLGGIEIDALQVDAAMREGAANLDFERLNSLLSLLRGEFLEGLELVRSPQLEHWLASQRRHY